MSIAVLNQVYDEARRLAVAGSVVAKGDFRLKKLLPPLDQAGVKAPVFAKVSEAAKKVIEGPEALSAESLLELTSLVTAVLYTQGKTGQPGDLKPIDPINLGGELAQTSARLLKPLLESLRNTGSGRLEVIKEAHERGAFRDLRLIKPALEGLDDSYSEIADFLAEKVLPMYGTAILPELRKAYDPKGTKGHPRRLKLMHAIDAAATRDLVKQALTDGAKEVKVAAISCLGADKEDLSYLIEQAAAKTQDIRGAAYAALANIDDPAAVAVLEKAIAGKDLDLAVRAFHKSKSERLSALLVSEVQKEWAALPKLKDKKQVADKVQRLMRLIGALPQEEHKASNDLTLELFARRAELAKVKGTNWSGADVTEAVVDRMMDGPKSLQAALARAHAELEPDQLAGAFHAGRRAIPPAELYDLFSPYLTAKVDEKKKKDPAYQKRAAVLDGLDADYIHWYRYEDEDDQPLDPRWLDLALKMKHLGMVCAVGQPGHAGAEAFLQAEYEAAAKKAKNPDQLHNLISVLVRLKHPKAADAVLAAYEKEISKKNPYPYYYYHLIPDLPKSAIPRLEALVPRLKGTEADNLLEAIQELRNKKD
jgi:hypothetical protein